MTSGAQICDVQSPYFFHRVLRLGGGNVRPHLKVLACTRVASKLRFSEETPRPVTDLVRQFDYARSVAFGDPDVESQSRSVLSQSSTVASYACKCKLYIAELQVRFECSAVSRPLICSLACTDQAAGPGSERSPGRKKFRIGRRHEQSKLVPNPIFVFPWVWWQPANGYGHIYPAIFTHYRCSQSIACLLIR
jgi:hypothetical protein